MPSHELSTRRPSGTASGLVPAGLISPGALPAAVRMFKLRLLHWKKPSSGLKSGSRLSFFLRRRVLDVEDEHSHFRP